MKQHEMSENRGLFALAATVVCLTAAISPSFAFGENLINGAFEPRGNEVIYNNSFPARGDRPFVIDHSEDVVTNLSGVVRLPGTFADAKLGRVMTVIAGEDEDAASGVLHGHGGDR